MKMGKIITQKVYLLSIRFCKSRMVSTKVRICIIKPPSMQNPCIVECVECELWMSGTWNSPTSALCICLLVNTTGGNDHIIINNVIFLLKINSNNQTMYNM